MSENTQSTAKRLLAGLFLGAAFSVVFALILVILSTLELQRAVLTSQISKDGSVTIGSIRLDVSALDKADDAQNATAQKLDLLRPQQTTVIRNVNNAVSDLDKSQAALIKAAHNFALLHAQIIDPRTQFPQPPPGAGYALRERLDSFEETIRKSTSQGPASVNLDSLIGELESNSQTALSDYDRALERWRTADNARTALTAEIDALKNTPAALPDSFKNPAYKAMVEDFRENKWLFGTFSFIPNMMLVLLLSICMGMLGSLIFLSRELVESNSAKSIGEMSFRIGLGAAVALALFFFASAGVLALSTGQQAQQMSPYLISFLGITAGYLSDRVTSWMREVGEKTFQLENPAQPERWAIHLGDLLQAQNPPLTTDLLAEGIGASKDDVAAWSQNIKTVPFAYQALVSAYLRKPRYELFTDICPKPAAA